MRAAQLDYADISRVLIGFNKPYVFQYRVDSETAALMIAVKQNNTATAKVLIQAGVSLTCKDD